MYRIIFLLLLGIQTFGQTYTGTKTPYPFVPQKYTPVPKGFAPVFVNYVGRHGARFMTKAGSDLKVLEMMADITTLTPLGKEIKKSAARFLEVEKDNYENITLLGAKEQEAIGARMVKRDKPAFKGRGVDVQVTHKKRTRQSADHLVKKIPGAHQFLTVDENNENVLRFYDMSPAYDAYKAGKVIADRLDTLAADPRNQQMAEAVTGRLFTRSLPAQEQLAFMEALYDLYSVQFSVALEAGKRKVDVSKAFTTHELAWLSFRSNAEDFLEKGPSLDTLGIQTKIAAPLLLDLITTTDAALQGRLHKDAILRATHAEAISPLATLMGIPAASVPSNSIYHFADHWKAEDIIPLSANIQWTLYANGKETLVRVLLNEKEVALPVATKCAPYYPWKVVRQYYLSLLEKIGVQPGDDMQKYLLNVK